MKKIQKTLAEICYFAQEHVCDPEAWPIDIAERETLFTCTDFVIACYLSKNTVEGDEGVECNIIIEELADNTLNKDGFMVKSLKEWEKIINKKAKLFGGFKK